MSWVDNRGGSGGLHHFAVVLLRSEARGLGEHVAYSFDGCLFCGGVSPALGQADLFRGEDFPARGSHDIFKRGEACLPQSLQVP